MESFSQALFDIVHLCNNGRSVGLTPLIVKEVIIGQVPETTVSLLDNYPDIFIKTKDSIILNPRYQTYRQCSGIFNKVLRDLKGYGLLKDWRNEELEVNPYLAKESLLRTERAGFPMLGMVMHGVHINGFTRNSENKIDKIWFGVRPASKRSFPDKLDQIVAGVMSVKDSCINETAEREGYEEAGLSSELISMAKPSGSVSYLYTDQNGVFSGVRYTMDLELAPEFIPQNTDGDVQNFISLSVNEAKQALIEKKFRFNSALVLIDFFIRHGIITPDNEPRYYHLFTWMHLDPLWLESVSESE